MKDESNELDEIYAAILKSNPELATDSPSTPQTYYTNEPITYDGMRKVLGGNGSGTPDGLYAMGVGLSIAAKKGGEIAADELLLNDIETLRDPNASKTDKGIALFSLTPMGKLKKAAEGIEEGKDLLEHVIEVQKKAEKAKDTKKSVDVKDVEHNIKGKSELEIKYPLSSTNKKHINKHNIESIKQQSKYLSDSQLADKLESSFFNPKWSKDDINKYVEIAYNDLKSQGKTGNLTYEIGGERIDVFIHPDGQFGSVYGRHKFTVEEIRKMTK